MGNKKANTTLTTQETCAILAGLHLLQAFADDAVAIDGDGHFAWVVEATHKCDSQEEGLSEDEISNLLTRINTNKVLVLDRDLVEGWLEDAKGELDYWDETDDINGDNAIAFRDLVATMYHRLKGEMVQ